MNVADDEVRARGAHLSSVVRWRDGKRQVVDDWLTEEVPVALEFNGISHAVMLATPNDLDDFALGFGLAEGIFDTAADLYGSDVVTRPEGITVSMEIASRNFARLKERRRTLAGRTGCGICGTENLSEVMRPLPSAPIGLVVEAVALSRAMRDMGEHQLLCRATGAVHAAAWCALDGRVQLLREDVGRHNALDKLIGAMAKQGVLRTSGFIAVTSRASVEMVQKAAIAGSSLLAAVSAPTQLAVDTAASIGMTLVGLVRRGDMVIYSHPERVLL